MALDSYSPCPGGRDKKIRFCCSDMTKELDQINSMLESGQTAACLAFIENLEKKHPDCACLDSAKCSILRTLERWGDALATATRFAEREPKNIVAKTELAIVQAALGMSSESIATIVDAIELNEKGQLHHSVPFAVYAVARCLLEDGLIVPAIALAKQLQSYLPQNREAADLLALCLSSVEFSLFLKEQTFDPFCPDDFSGKAKYMEAILLLRIGYWKQGLALLEALLPSGKEWVNLYRSVAVVRLWFNDRQGCAELLERFIQESSQTDDNEDLIDARTLLASLDSSDLFGDNLDVVKRTYSVQNFDNVLEKLLSTPTFDVIGDETSIPRGDANSPAPKKVFAILDKAFPEVGETPTLENSPCSLGVLSLFGAETDRPARIEANLYPVSEAAAIEAVRQNLGDLLGECETEVLTQNSRTLLLLFHRFHFRSFEVPSEKIQNELYAEYLEKVFVDQWLNLPLGKLDGRTPIEAVATFDGRVKVQAILNLFETKIHPCFAELLIGLIRTRLNLEPPREIPLPEILSTANLQNLFATTPSWRWYRVDFSKLPTPELPPIMQMVHFIRDSKSLLKIAPILLERPMAETRQEDRNFAFNVLIAYYLEIDDADQALLWTEKARNEADELKQSDSQWNLAELMICERKQDIRRSSELLQHLLTAHKNEQETMQQLQALLVQWGFVNPDGTLRRSGPRPDASFGAAKSTEPEPPTSGLWTPESDKPSNDSNGGSKLWIPD